MGVWRSAQDPRGYSGALGIPPTDRHTEPMDGPRLALVMSGGGARAAYQVGLLRCLAHHHPGLFPPVLTGVSAGAINAAYLAAHPGDLGDSVEGLSQLWCRLDVEDVFRVGPLGLFTKAARWAVSLGSGGKAASGRGLVDTSPLAATLGTALGQGPGESELTGIGRNLASGRLEAVAITAASYTTGRSVTFTQSADPATLHGSWDRAHRRSRETRLGVDHVLASAALPFFFPAVRVGEAWYGDGGMRLTAPLSPAIHLGADRILAISTRYLPQAEEVDEPQIPGYPSAARVAGLVLNSIFLDQFDADALRLERINELLARTPAAEHRDLRRVRLLLLRPSRDLGKLANDYEPRLPRTLRFLTRGLGTREVRSNDLLSLLMFQADYLQRLIDLGEADAEAQRPRIEAFLGEA